MEPVASRPADVQCALDAAMVRIRTHTGEVVGSGFLVEAGHIVTCAHVVARALGREDWEAPAETDTVSLDFPLVAAGVMVQARIEVWHPIQDGKTISGQSGGRYVAASSSSGETRLWDTRSNDHTGTALPFGNGQSMSFSPDGRWLSIGGQNEIRLWDLDAERIDSRRIPVGSFSMKFSPDSSLLAVDVETPIGQYGKISVWNVRDVQLRGTAAAALAKSENFSFTSDNSRLAVGGSGVFVEPFDASWALWHVCRIVKRNLTREEWNKYLAGSDYVPTCPS